MIRIPAIVKRIHVVGRKNHGKTKLIVELIKECSRRGLRVGVIKHSSHQHELDTPGKDSYLQREAGAVPVAVVTTDLIGLYAPRSEDVDFLDYVAPMFANCDLVLIEGYIDGSGTKIEVWRQAIGGPCLASGREDIIAVVTNDPLEPGVPIWRRDNVGSLADRILTTLGNGLR